MVEHRARGQPHPESTTLQLGIGAGLLWAWTEHHQAPDPGTAKRAPAQGLRLVLGHISQEVH